MFMVVYTGIWFAVTVFSGLVGFMMGRLRIVDASWLPWVMHRSYVPPQPPDDAPRPWPERTPGWPDFDNRQQA
jgi:hypothetical protein